MSLTDASAGVCVCVWGHGTGTPHTAQAALTWANIGFVHMLRQDVESANKAFGMAQMLDPSWTAGWAGQSLLAVQLGSEEAAELLAHAVNLGRGTQVGPLPSLCAPGSGAGGTPSHLLPRKADPVAKHRRGKARTRTGGGVTRPSSTCG